jgi:hypothetical protein
VTGLCPGKVFIDFNGFFEYKESLDETGVPVTGCVSAGPDEGVTLARSWKIFSSVTAIFSILLLCGCLPLEKMDKASGTIEETDYLNRLAGIYEAVIQPEAGDETILTLRLYPDGTCLFFEKTIGGPSGGGPSGGILISTGRWDHSDFSEGVTLHLKSKNGARRVMPCSQDEGTGSLIYSGQGYGPDGLTLIKR